MDNFSVHFKQLFVGHGAVSGAKIHSFGRDLANASARADGLIVDLNVGVNFMVLIKPFAVDRIWERSPRSVEYRFGQRVNYWRKREERG
jgi:hypothetical protein